MGYHRAGFDIVGVDIAPQPNYPFKFHQADALEFPLDGFAAIHASPPCQRWTRAQRQRKNANAHPDLVTPTRELLGTTGLPYVIENVEGAPLHNPVVLCGSMFDLDVQYHRLFETDWVLNEPVWPCRHGIWGKHRFPGTPNGSGQRPGGSVVNRMAQGTTHEQLATALDIDWMPARGVRPTTELREAIPPAYTEFIGTQLLEHLTAVAA